MSQMAAGRLGGLLPMRITRKAPSCTHSKVTYPFAVSVGSGRKAAFESSISQSPTKGSRCLSAGLCWCELICAILLLLLIEALPRLSQLWREFLQQPQIAIWVAEAGVLHSIQ